jgi:hypothetical protein
MFYLITKLLVLTFVAIHLFRNDDLLTYLAVKKCNLQRSRRPKNYGRRNYPSVLMTIEKKQ